jgi:O-Antigen ligase
MAVRTALIQRTGRETFLVSGGAWLCLVLMGWGAGLVLAQATGRLETTRAVVLLLLPGVAIGVAIRPAWVVLLLAALPMAALQLFPGRVLDLLLLATLGGLLVVRRGVSVGWRSGFLGIGVLLAAASFHRADLTGETALIARGFWNDLAFYALIVLVTYNATRIGDLRGTSLVNALLTGLTLSVILENTSLASAGRLVSYLAAVGFALCFARIIIRTEDGHYYHRGLHTLLAILFLMAMIPDLVRGAWLGALIAVFVVSLLAHKRRYWVLIIAALIAILIVPVTRERVVPSQAQAIGGGYTTGRLDLWSRLWDRVESGWPLGNGFGYTFTLTSPDLFGPGSSQFYTSPDQSFVYPHNDFIFWMVELGLIGLLGMLLFYGQLVMAFRSVSRFKSPNRIHAQILIGALITGFVSQLVVSTFFFRALAVPFFTAAGFIFGAREIDRIVLKPHARASNVASVSSTPAESRGSRQ